MSEAIERKESPLKYQTRCIEVNPDGLSYAVGSIEGRVGIQYFNPAPEVQAKTYAFKCHRKEDMGNVVVYPVNCISYNTVNGFFVTGGSDSFVNLWDGENKKRIWKLKQYPSAISSIAFSQSGKQLAIACSYMYEEGDIPNQPPVKLFIKDM
jgi:cell cycle arrest protein BUB3